MRLAPAIAAAALTIAGAAGAAPPAPAPALFLGLTWIDTSAEGSMNGVRADQTARLAMIEEQIDAALTGRGFTIRRVTAPERPPVADPSDCNGCDTSLARDLGTTYAISGRVQKVSNLILSITLFVREAESGRTVAAGSVDMRGNTDESWSRGARYLLDNIIFRATPPG